MLSVPSDRPAVQFTVVDLLVVFAGIAAALGICITLAELDNARGTHSGWSSEVQMIDGSPDVVVVPVRISTDSGRIISSSYYWSLHAALAIEIGTLVAVIVYLVRRRRKAAVKLPPDTASAANGFVPAAEESIEGKPRQSDQSPP